MRRGKYDLGCGKGLLSLKKLPMRMFVLAINHENRTSKLNLEFAQANSDFPDV